jgi:nucleotide-binding universal stress UspA family protein
VAIRYACEIAKSTQSSVHLLHIVDEDDGMQDAHQKLTAQAQRMAHLSTNIEVIAKEGSIFEDVAAIAKSHGAELIVMGTHGLRGMQFIVGSNALRIVSESSVPIIIVQEETKASAQVKKVLAPLDLHKETKQKLRFAADVAERYAAEVHLISPKESDEFLNNRLERNVLYSEGYLEERGVRYVSHVTNSDEGDFVRDLLAYADKENVDLICILNTTEDRLIHAFGIDAEQKIITNDAHIPVMILNRTMTYKDDRSIFAQ